MIILVDLLQAVAYFKMSLVVVHPMLLAAVRGDATVGTLETDVRGSLSCRSCRLSPFWVIGVESDSGLSVCWVWAVCVLLHEGRAAAYLGRG
jgi:hypothetical protein